MRLEGKSAVVTGASKGIGKDIAVKLAKEGAKVLVNYNSNKEKAEEVVNLIKSQGGEAECFKADVSNFEEATTLIKECEKLFGRVDILVNNAGITSDNLILKMDDEQWKKVIDANLNSVFNCTKAVSKIMLKQKSGKIVNISSVVGVVGNAGQGNYAASKAGMIGFSKSIAAELGSRNINVNVIAPGYIETDMTDKLSDDIKEEMLKKIPMRSLGKPEDIANLTAFLSSDEAKYITGQVISVDGGMTMS